MSPGEERTGIVGDGLLKIPAAAEFLGISIAKLYQMMASGELAFVKLGRSSRIPRRALVDLAAKNLVIRPQD
jgi:excisionase family DNA binding protein